MQIVHTREELAHALENLEGTIGLVMTMGALHAGHLSLVQAAKTVSDHQVVSIYVNPLQFAPGEDYEAYPRDLEADCALLETVGGVDVVYNPIDDDIYPREPLVRINPGPVATVYEGKTRPTHFAGVLQIVHKVFNLVRPDFAWFGQKDAQQLALIRTMVADLNMPLEIKAVPIKREDSGLAMSSRNQYLSEAEREDALTLSRALSAGVDAAKNGANAPAALAAARAVVDANPNVKLDYLDLVDDETFIPLVGAGQGRFIIAAWVGATRLIDNMEVTIG